ncbi:hypothetical protein E0H22_17960 [Rhodopseudomonas boonkerdii]|uniref:hypothetical protein n=1 Tax=Rhodopseudomonas boonkerdii TaxID=475937 RepID=UPI001E4A6B9F|nr:hypothetical protein [Rhodopseudomonas boonkerdii]UGV27401.1 hypothetical protein E0H22_17960 [Rhodopseudomonas boonkerdii]
MTIERVPEHSPPFILRSRDMSAEARKAKAEAASRRMAAHSRAYHLMVRDARKGALLTMRGEVTQ